MKLRDPFDEGGFFPELTPLIDIMFLLLVFFMLTTTFLKETERKAIPVELPQALHSSIVTASQAVVITVNERGGYSIDGMPCDAASLPDVLKLKTVGDTTVVISGHTGAPYRSIVYIYDVLQSLGISRFAHDVR
jgi:biopolymer transport protein ExbD